MAKDFRIYRYYPSGAVVYCASFSSPEKANRVMEEWKEKNPSAMYQVHEINL